MSQESINIAQWTPFPVFYPCAGSVIVLTDSRKYDNKAKPKLNLRSNSL